MNVWRVITRRPASFLRRVALAMGAPPQSYVARKCQGAAWRRAYPASSAASIRSFLSLFTNAFAFADSYALHFAPTDRPMSIYRALYPRLGWSDALEVETLRDALASRHGIQLGEIWHDDLTLGEIFQQTQPSGG